MSRPQRRRAATDPDQPPTEPDSTGPPPFAAAPVGGRQRTDIADGHRRSLGRRRRHDEPRRALVRRRRGDLGRRSGGPPGSAPSTTTGHRPRGGQSVLPRTGRPRPPSRPHRCPTASGPTSASTDRHPDRRRPPADRDRRRRPPPPPLAGRWGSRHVLRPVGAPRPRRPRARAPTAPWPPSGHDASIATVATTAPDHAFAVVGRHRAPQRRPVDRAVRRRYPRPAPHRRTVAASAGRPGLTNRQRYGTDIGDPARHRGGRRPARRRRRTATGALDHGLDPDGTHRSARPPRPDRRARPAVRGRAATAATAGPAAGSSPPAGAVPVSPVPVAPSTGRRAARASTVDDGRAGGGWPARRACAAPPDGRRDVHGDLRPPSGRARRGEGDGVGGPIRSGRLEAATGHGDDALRQALSDLHDHLRGQRTTSPSAAAVARVDRRDGRSADGRRPGRQTPGRRRPRRERGADRRCPGGRAAATGSTVAGPTTGRTPRRPAAVTVRRHEALPEEEGAIYDDRSIPPSVTRRRPVHVGPSSTTPRGQTSSTTRRPSCNCSWPSSRTRIPTTRRPRARSSIRPPSSAARRRAVPDQPVLRGAGPVASGQPDRPPGDRHGHRRVDRQRRGEQRPAQQQRRRPLHVGGTRTALTSISEVSQRSPERPSTGRVEPHDPRTETDPNQDEIAAGPTPEATDERNPKGARPWSSSLIAAVSGIEANQTYLDVVGNNIANANTTGYKSEDAVFTDLLAEQVAGARRCRGRGCRYRPHRHRVGRPDSAPSPTIRVRARWSRRTPTDVAIQGDGFLVAEQEGQQLYTGPAHLTVDANGDLAAHGGLIQGWEANATGTSTPRPAHGHRDPHRRGDRGDGDDRADVGATCRRGTARGRRPGRDHHHNGYDSLGEVVPVTLTLTGVAGRPTSGRWPEPCRTAGPTTCSQTPRRRRHLRSHQRADQRDHGRHRQRQRHTVVAGDDHAGATPSPPGTTGRSTSPRRARWARSPSSPARRRSPR